MDWQPIESAPKDGTPVLLGYEDRRGKFAVRSGKWVIDIYFGRTKTPIGAWVCTMDTALVDGRASLWAPYTPPEPRPC